ncbi:MAG: hypothetical protein QXI72_06825 [Candidatus Nezhaarchaeales archaeon]
MKRKFLELLEKDLEFRYAVAGYLGLSEILKRLDVLAEEQIKIAKEQMELRREQIRLAEEQVKLREEQTRIWVEIAGLREDFNRMREDFNRMYRQLDIRLTRVERTLEKITLDIGEEARIIVKYRLREMGYDVEVGSLILPEAEINIYGVSDEICVVGEASVRASANIIDKINDSLEKLRTQYPDKLRSKILKVVYTSLAMPDLIERAEKEDIWVLKATGDTVKPKIYS